ncbi:putative ferulic acid esterase [Erysiphe necator]|uniref:feruloyl esterase n=1 Tax=Uncinula necator TaxID=52586 RepID=A0A0B1PFQ3_UNCNE|nr:putative ferulic acid esterase [Erysiphe necator]
MLPLILLLYQQKLLWIKLFERHFSATLKRLPLLRFPFFLPFLFISVVTSNGTSGCGCDLPVNLTPGGPSIQVPIQLSNGLNRSYLLHLPVTYDKNTATPLIFSFHGRGHNSSFQEALSGFSRPDWNPDAIVVYPQGINDTWQGDPESTNVNDMKFVSDMISSLSSNFCLDDERIYAAGKSNGGGFTNLLACDPQLSTQIAAFAPVSPAIYFPNVKSSDCSGSIPNTLHFPCYPGRKIIPILGFHGIQDEIIPYNGGPHRSSCVISLLHWLEEWANMQGFGSGVARTSLFDGNITKLEFAPCTENQGIITHYALNNWYHDWPSRKPSVDTMRNTYIDASPIIIDFFNNHPLTG